MATMHYFWMKFDCQANPTGGGKTAAASTASVGLKELTGATVRSGPGGGGSGPQSSGSEVQGGTVRQGGGSGGGSGPQGTASDGGAATFGATVRSRAEVDTPKTGVISFNLLHERVGGLVGEGTVSFYCIDRQIATRFPDEASALKEKDLDVFKVWCGKSVAVLTCIETP